MSEPIPISLFGRLMLVRVLVAGDKGATPNDLKKALEPLFGHRLGGAALGEQLTQTLGQLESAGLLKRSRKGKTERATPTPEGARRACEFLGVEQLPPRTTWLQITKSYLTAFSLGLGPPRDKGANKQLGTDTGFQAALIKAQFELPLNDYPSFNQALDALAWTLLGCKADSRTKFNVNSVKAMLIIRALEGRAPLDAKANPRKEVLKLLAKKVGARQSGTSELRLAALRQWIDRTSPPGSTRSVPTPVAAPAPARPLVPSSASSPPPASLDLDTFARRVLETARACPTGRFGDDKVFVVHIFRSLSHDPVFAAMGLDGFKQKLAEANNARRLDLGRADMVEAMDPADVELSKVTYLGSEFHFVRI